VVEPKRPSAADVVIEAVAFDPETDPVVESMPPSAEVTKSEFVDRVAADSGLSKKDASFAVDAVIKSIATALSEGEEVNFTGFGKFHVAERGAREGRNPRTGETMTIAASKVPRFTASSGISKKKDVK
jgi:DNA-binding protein HU-beta